MATEWYYEEEEKVRGPVSAEEIVDRIRRAQGQPHLLWTAGLSEWTDARRLPQFSTEFQTEEPAPFEKTEVGAERRGKGGRETLVQRARHELIAYLAISGYLLVWFSAVMFYKATILRSVGMEFAPFGLAAVKALILGKFILALEALKIGEGGKSGGVLAVQILWRAFLFTLLLIVLSIAEEAIVGYFHGRPAMEALREIGGGTVPQAFAVAVLMFLVLLPYLAFRRLALTYGRLPELLFTRRLPAKRE
ncbi:MAG TPA: DUF4339 domain-containing protein [Methylocystis sp.]|nr:DUF4339 domain-containing protein [Methylocystis sp.]